MSDGRNTLNNPKNVANKNIVTIVHMNIQCITNKTAALELFAQEQNVDVLCVSEHWLTNQNCNLYNIKNYTMAAIYCRPLSQGRGISTHGGVCIYLKNHLKSSEIINIREMSTERDFEMVGIHIPDVNLVILVSYRSNRGNTEKYFENLDTALMHIERSFPVDTKILLTGDFNMDLMKSEKIQQSFLELTNSHGLRRGFYEPTRICGQSQTCIDNIFSNVNMAGLQILQSLGDHTAQRVQITYHNTKLDLPKFIKKRSFKIQNVSKFSGLLEKVQWDFSQCFQNPEAMFEIFFSIFMQHFNESFPLEMKNKGSSTCNDNMKETLKLMRRLQDAGWVSFEMVQKYRTHICKIAEEEKKKSKIMKINCAANKQKTIWQIINEETGRTRREDAELGRPSCENFNQHFLHAADDQIKKMLANCKNTKSVDFRGFPVGESSLFLAPTCPREVLSTINKLKNKQTEDIYGISVELLKRVGHLICTPLAEIFNQCFCRGCFPDRLKLARVVPIHKKGSTTDCENYRPIAVLPAFSKILEALILERMNAYFNKNNYFTDQQYGFRSGRGTTGAVSSMLLHVIQAMEQKEKCMSHMCDLSMAFDSMSHEMFLRKAEHYGVRGTALSLLNSYLKSRKQVVIDGGNRSTEGIGTRGVPQGSLLGPLFFVIFMNDLPLNLNCRTVMYADDTTISLSGRNQDSVERSMDQMMERVESWFRQNELYLNKGKSARIRFTADRWDVTDEPVKFLGIWLDSRLTWSDHVEDLRRRLSKAIYAIRRTSQIAGTTAAIVAYHALFSSVMSYCITAWGHTPHLKDILIVQKKAVRCLEGASARCSCRPLFQKYKIMTAPAIYIYRTLTDIHLKRHELRKRGDTHMHQTRTRDCLDVPMVRLSTSSQLAIGVQLYNRCPKEWRKMTTTRFGRVLRDYLTDRPVYSFSEFV